MKNICTINCELPTVEGYIGYFEEQSLLDFDIILFNPVLPYLERIQFGGGGSTIEIEAGKKLLGALKHWKIELSNALKAGKTIFILLNKFEEDSLAMGYTSPRKNSRNYTTQPFNNYDILPFKLELRNAKGKRFGPSKPEFKGLYEVIKNKVEYQVLVETKTSEVIFTTPDNAGVVGGIIKLKDRPGKVFLLPYFKFPNTSETVGTEEHWTEDSIRSSKQIISQLIEIDKHLKLEEAGTPPPSWLEDVLRPKKISQIDSEVNKLDADINEINEQKDNKLKDKKELLKYQSLLFENGKKLEISIEDALKLLGYKVENFREGDIEIDHIITSPEGLRMIGESEGKDTSAVNISKFRQLESNINEDFNRDNIEQPAKGVLFGNGYRLKEPENRKDQFTSKCLVNAERLNTALVQTSDLYSAVLHVIDNPDDEKFKEDCRKALEETNGSIVKFPASGKD